MLIDLLSSDNYVPYNVKIAKLLGLNTAVYLSVIISMSNEVIRNNSNPEGYFVANPDKIESLTTLDLEEQLFILDRLKQLKIVYNKPEKNSENLSDFVKIDFQAYISLLTSDDENVTSKLVKFATKPKTQKRVSNRKRDFENLKAMVICGNEELRKAYYDWIDGVYANPKGFLSQSAIITFQRGLDEFTKGDLDLALKILEIAAVGGYRDVQWAINAFHKDYEKDYRKKHQYKPVKSEEPQGENRKVELSSEEF